jgi:hypothetical protein
MRRRKGGEFTGVRGAKLLLFLSFGILSVKSRGRVWHRDEEKRGWAFHLLGDNFGIEEQGKEIGIVFELREIRDCY